MKRKKEDIEVNTLPHCSSCQQDTHLRSSSTKCPNYQPRQGKAKPIAEEEDFYYKKENFVYKQGLRTVLPANQRFKDGTTLEERIQQQVYKVTKNIYYATRFLQFHLQRCIETNLELPDITRTWIRQLLTHRVTDPNLQASKDLLGDDLPVLGLGVISQINTILCREYVVNFDVYLDTVYDKMHKKWMNKVLEIRGIPKKQRNKLVAYIYNNVLENPDDTELAEAYPDLISPWKENSKSSALKLRRMYTLNSLFTKWGGKLYNLVPQYTSQAKYITIDTDILYDLVKSDLTKRPRKEFGMQREDQWRRYTRIKSKFFSEGSDKKFNCEIKTDGVGCSVVLYKWILCPKVKSTKQEKEEKRQQRVEAHLQSLPNPDEIRWVGADPGRKDILSASDEEGYRFTLSSKKYYSSCKFIQKRDWKLRKLKELGIHDFLLALPTLKTHCSESTQLYLAQLQKNSSHMQVLFGLECARSTRHKRWKSYMHRQITLDNFCKDLLLGQPENTVVAYGDASFCHNTKGHAPSLKGNWIKHRLEKVHNGNVLMIKEYNTSQVCSKCHHDEKLVGLGSKRDPRRRDPKTNKVQVAVQKHFVRRCTHCLMIW